MIVSFDSHSGIVYIQVQPATKISQTREYDAETVVELDHSGDLVAIEMMKPNKMTLKRIAKKFERWELGRVDLESAQKSIE